ncbi:MAG: hypothetical protein GY930_02595 [bacterium]|nr:hypothetical protein [bacterium]
MKSNLSVFIVLLLVTSCISISHEAREPAPQEHTTEPVMFELAGSDFEIAKLESGGQAFSNRKYTWNHVPDHLEGVNYTRTAGGIRATMTLEALTPGVLHVAVPADRMLDMVDLGWTLAPLNRESTFAFSSADNQMMALMSRDLDNGETIAIPQLGWAGTLVIFITGLE